MPGGAGNLVSPLPHGAPRWGPLEASVWGRGWGCVQGPACSPKSSQPHRLQPPTTPVPGRSYLGIAQKNGHNSVQGAAPVLELGTRRSQHCHSRGATGTPGRQRRARRKLYLAAGICLVFMVGEAVGEWGVWGWSPLGHPKGWPPGCGPGPPLLSTGVPTRVTWPVPGLGWGPPMPPRCPCCPLPQAGTWRTAWPS